MTEQLRPFDLKDDETMDEKNVDKFIVGAIKSYADKNMILDSIFWREVMVNLQKKYGFKLRVE